MADFSLLFLDVLLADRFATQILQDVFHMDVGSMTVIHTRTIRFLGVIFYGIFASGELQPWAEPPSDPNKIPNWKIRQMSIKQPSSAGPTSQAPATQLNSNAPMPTAQAQVDINGQTTSFPIQQNQYGDPGWNQGWDDQGGQQGYGSTGNYKTDGTRYRNY